LALAKREQQNESGGEGGIRTLGTGVSPYNGLAKGSFSPPSLVFKGLEVGFDASASDPGPLIRQLLCSALCSTLHVEYRQLFMSKTDIVGGDKTQVM
jgi:hypothetical protein